MTNTPETMAKAQARLRAQAYVPPLECKAHHGDDRCTRPSEHDGYHWSKHSRTRWTEETDTE